ncbi:hypothetical protein NUSPORA_01935 [Nucleospora cyclopteri]
MLYVKTSENLEKFLKTDFRKEILIRSLEIYKTNNSFVVKTEKGLICYVLNDKGGYKEFFLRPINFLQPSKKSRKTCFLLEFLPKLEKIEVAFVKYREKFPEIEIQGEKCVENNVLFATVNNYSEFLCGAINNDKNKLLGYLFDFNGFEEGRTEKLMNYLIKKWGFSVKKIFTVPEIFDGK